ncbi:hypothetical protein [Actinomycetospora soli]|uniref:hypothetical protein n=1 Tax=Actinomycetospora soli TaxID=2893887 RepID=UPI001E31FF07|nr:hypothetical protein [Actinomycetospora soli]MCD2191353.1 hypothetical protein [Actinomycetospora soli]
MSCAGLRPTPDDVSLSDTARDALRTQLFAYWEAAEPGSHKCFCGSDAELVAAVERYRDEQDRERG